MARMDIRDGEIVTDAAFAPDAIVTFVGTIRTPFATRRECPRQGRLDGPDCTIVVGDTWTPALAGLEAYSHIEVLYWLDRAARDFLVQRPKQDGPRFGTFALRSPNRPNPIGTSLVKLVRIQGSKLTVRGLDCVDGTALIDLKPDRSAFVPKAPEKAADR